MPQAGRGRGVTNNIARKMRQAPKDAFRDVAALRPREEVYREDVPHGPADTWVQVPPEGTPERVTLVARMLELRAQGWTYLAISNELNINMYTIQKIIRKERNHG